MRARCTSYLAVAVLLFGIGLGIGLGIAQAPTGLATLPANAAVTLGAERTLAQHTAAFVLSGAVAGGGGVVTLRGSGFVSFRDGDTLLSLWGGARGAGFRALGVGGASYLEYMVGGRDISTVLPGKHWISLGLGEGPSGNPSAPFLFVSGGDNLARPLGLSKLHGRLLYGYSVTATRQSVERALSDEHLGAVPPDLRQQIRTEAAELIPTVAVWFDSSGLLRKMAFQFVAGPVTAALTLTTTRFGVPVRLSAPPATATIDYDQFLRAAGELALPPH